MRYMTTSFACRRYHGSRGYRAVMVPRMPAAAWPGTVQTNAYVPGVSIVNVPRAVRPPCASILTGLDTPSVTVKSWGRPPPFRSVSSTGWPARTTIEAGANCIELPTVTLTGWAPGGAAGAGIAATAPGPLVVAAAPQAVIRATPAMTTSRLSVPVLPVTKINLSLLVTSLVWGGHFYDTRRRDDVTGGGDRWDRWDRWTRTSGWLTASRSSGPTCGRWPTACSARSPRRTTPSRTPGCASAGPARAGARARSTTSAA